MARKKLDFDNPLVTGSTQEPEQEPKRRRKPGPKLKTDMIRTPGAQEFLREGQTRKTYIMKIKHVDFIDDYAYTKRIKKQDALAEIIQSFIDAYESNPEHEELLKK